MLTVPFNWNVLWGPCINGSCLDGIQLHCLWIWRNMGCIALLKIVLGCVRMERSGKFFNGLLTWIFLWGAHRSVAPLDLPKCLDLINNWRFSTFVGSTFDGIAILESKVFIIRYYTIMIRIYIVAIAQPLFNHAAILLNSNIYATARIFLFCKSQL